VSAPEWPAADQAPLYRHYKGGLYRKLGVVTHSETEESLVLYRAEATGRLWVRPAAMWDELVDGAPRFALVGASPA
jgi:hypothetical protein